MLTSRKIKGLFFTLVWLWMVFLAGGFSAKAAAVDNLLTFPELQIKPKETGAFGLALCNITVVGGLQIQFTYNALPGFQMTGVSLTPRTTGFEVPVLQMNMNDSGEVNVLLVVYSLYGAVILPGTGAIVTVHYQTSADVGGGSPLRFTETVLADLASKPLPVAFKNGRIDVADAFFPAFFDEPMDVCPSVPAIPEPTTLIFWLLGVCLIWTCRQTYLQRRQHTPKKF